MSDDNMGRNGSMWLVGEVLVNELDLPYMERSYALFTPCVE